MARQLTVRNLFDKKYKLFEFKGLWADVFGQPEQVGSWLIYGPEKHGKTWIALAIAKMLSATYRVSYISGEEGTSVDFRRAVKRAGISVNDKVKILPYQPLEELEALITKRYAPQVLFIDNTTIYEDEITKAVIREFHKKYDSRLLIIYVAHEDRKKPYPANAALASRLARIKIRVEGLAAHVSGRCPGGIINIDEEKAQLYHGKKQ